MEITRLEWLVMEETSFFTGLLESTLLKFHHLFLGIKFCVSSTNIYYCFLPICIKLAHILNKSGVNYCVFFFSLMKCISQLVITCLSTIT